MWKVVVACVIIGATEGSSSTLPFFSSLVIHRIEKSIGRGSIGGRLIPCFLRFKKEERCD